ncbi:HEAT repeat domain-containing protein [bacterium]|nr:HEAT repeat domain-containing protein [bacterium]
MISAINLMKSNAAQYVSLIALIFIVSGCATMSSPSPYKKAQAANTVEAYEEYIEKNPDRFETDLMRSKLASMKDRDDYFRARAINSNMAYQEFIDTHEESEYTDKAKAMLALTGAEAYAKTMTFGTRRAFEGFIGSYPDSQYIFEAKDRLKWMDEQADHEIGVVISINNSGMFSVEEKKKEIWGKLQTDTLDTGVKYTLLSSANDLKKKNIRSHISIEYFGDGGYKMNLGDSPAFVPVYGNISTGDALIMGAVAGITLNTIKLLTDDNDSDHELSNVYHINIVDNDIEYVAAEQVFLDRSYPSMFIKYYEAMKWIAESETFPYQSFRAILGMSNPQIIDLLADTVKQMPKTFYEQLVAALEDEHGTVRAAAAKVLSITDPPYSLDNFVSLLEDQDAHVRKEAVLILKNANDKKYYHHLTRALNDQSDEVLLAALSAQSIMKVPEAMDDVINFLNHANEEVRIQAAYTLYFMDDKRAVDALIASLEDENTLVRIRAEHALESITGQKFRSDAEKWQKWWNWQKWWVQNKDIVVH